MTSIDDKIKQALNEEFNEYIDENNKINSSITKQFKETLKGRNKIGYFFVIIFYILSAYGFYRFGTDTTGEVFHLLRWIIVGLFFGIIGLFGEHYFYSQIGRNKIMREIKLIQLQLAKVLENQDK